MIVSKSVKMRTYDTAVLIVHVCERAWNGKGCEYPPVCNNIMTQLGNDLVVLLHRVKSEMRSEKNSPPKLSRLTTAAYHYRSWCSWTWSIEFCFLTPLLLTRIVVCLFVIDTSYKYETNWWLTNTTLRSELESRDWKVNFRAVTQNHFQTKAFCLYYGQNHFCP